MGLTFLLFIHKLYSFIAIFNLNFDNADALLTSRDVRISPSRGPHNSLDCGKKIAAFPVSAGTQKLID